MKALHIAFHALVATLIALIALPKAIGLTLLYYVQGLPFAQINEGAPADFKALAEATNKALKEIGDQVKEAGQKALAEAKKFGDMYAADKPNVDAMLIKQGELQAELAEVQKKMARAGEADQRRDQSAGQLLVSSDEFKKWLADGGKKRQSGFVYELPHAALISVDQSTTQTVGSPPDVRPGVIPGTERRLTVRDLISPGSTDASLVQYVRESGFTNNAAVVSEGDKKPESTLTYEIVQSPVTTIAHFFKASKQTLDDFKGLSSMIDQRGRYGLKLVEENQLLKGSGVGNNLNGIYTQATAYSAPFALPGGFTKIDVIRLMLLQAELAEYPATGIVMHPSDWAAIELTKDADRGYIFANPQSMAQPMLWGRAVVATQAMTIDTALVGAFRLGAQIFDREDANVVISTENEDDFVRNMITIRVEERLALATYRPSAFVKNADLPAS